MLDAYCPHLGANIGIGGRVIGDCLECPFHGWQFRGSDGKVTKIPYADKSKLRLIETQTNQYCDGIIHDNLASVDVMTL